MSLSLDTPVCRLLGCDYPVVLAGMGGVARAELVAAVSEAGGFGLLGMVREQPDLIRAEVARVRAATTRDFGVNLIPAATKPRLLEAELAAVLELKVPVVALFWDLRADIVARLRVAGCLVLCQVGTVAEAEEAAAAGAHILVAQGREAGGHVRGESGLAALVPAVVSRVGVPVLAAGGIVDGRGLASALALGAQGAMIGTGFLATRESFAHDYHKRRVIEARSDATVLTRDFHINWPPGAAVRVLPNSVTRGERGDPMAPERQVIGADGARPIHLFSTDSPLRSMTGDFEAMALYAGEGAGRIGAVVSAAERLAAIVNEAAEIIGPASTGAAGQGAAELSSPACSAQEADAAYMGYADRAELVAFLNALLEAERALARAALRTALGTPDPRRDALLHAMHEDAARCSALLFGHIKALGAVPSARVGALYPRALEIADPGARLALLREGESDIVHKLREMLPRIRDDALHADLARMRQTHETNRARGGAC